VHARVIVNPASGGGRGEKRADDAVDTLRAKGWDLDVRHTRAAGHARDLAEEAAQDGVPTVIVAGGDGTTWEVVNGLLPAKGPVPRLGVLPVGTGNSFLRDFGIVDTKGALAALSRPTERPFDAIRVDHAGGVMHYVNLLSVGFTAEVGAVTNRWFKPLGAGGYAFGVVGSLVSLGRPSFPYALDGGEKETAPVTLISFSNSQYTGGTMRMAPGADPTDGLLDVVHVGLLGRRRLLATFPRIYRGTHVDMPEVRTARARVVELNLAGPVSVMVDGEVLDLHLRRLEVLPGALTLLA